MLRKITPQRSSPLKIAILLTSMENTSLPQISIVVPLYNEQEVLPLFLQRTDSVVEKLNVSCEYIFVDDGSNDNSASWLKEQAKNRPEIKLLSLSRNFGKEAALTAGLEHTQAQAVVCMDVDLQDPPELIANFYQKFQQGYDNIYGQRINRDQDPWFKRATAQSFYKIYNLFASPKMPYNAGDFRLLSRRAVNAVLQLPERERFMKGLFAWVGFKSIAVPYHRQARAVGKTKWNYWKLWNFALNGLTASTTLPLKLCTYFGAFISLASFVFAAWTAYKKIVFGNPVSGYTSIMVAILFFSGVQLITLGVIGEYLSRIFMEVKHRPAYLVNEKINF